MSTSLPIFIALTLCLGGGCAFMTGQAVANSWKPWGQVVPYCLLLGLADRFLAFALFGADLLSATGWIVDTAVLLTIGLGAWRLTLARRLCAQYPWLYARTGPFTWRDKEHAP